MLKTALIAAGLCAATTALAHGTGFDDQKLLKVTAVAVEKFKVENPDHVDAFYGYKAWKSGEDAKVDVYMKHGTQTMTISYLCHEHENDDGTPYFECHGGHDH